MKIKDLMIGDWFHDNYTDKNYQVWPPFFTQSTNFWKRLDATFEDVNIAPIPLTKEILEKNGFYEGDGDVYGDDNLFFIPIYQNFDIEAWETHIEPTECIGDFSGKLRYVHQLQHALKICGIDKTIEL